MLVTLLPMLTEVKEEHTEKAPPPMLVTLLGIVIEVRDLQALQRWAGIYFTFSPKVKEVS